MFTHLHGHSQFSLLEAIWSSKSIVSRLKELWDSYAPIFDYNGMYNIIAHYQICKKEDMKPLIGVDLAIQIQLQGKLAQSRFISLLAKNYEWYTTLLEIVSLAQTTSNNMPPHLPLNRFPDMNDTLFALINAYETPIGDMINNGTDKETLIRMLNSYQETFWEKNVILEIIPQDPKENKQLAEANKVIRQLHKATGIPVIVSDNFHYIYENDKEAYDIARCIKDAKHVYDEDRRKIKGKFHIMSEDEIYNQALLNGFSHEDTAKMIETWNQIAKEIDIQIDLYKLLFPIYENPEDIKKLYEQFQKSE